MRERGSLGREPRNLFGHHEQPRRSVRWWILDGHGTKEEARMTRVLFQTAPTTKLLQRLDTRDVALWIGAHSHDDPAALAALASLPWRLVICESDDAALAAEVTRRSHSVDEILTRKRGFLHVIASDPAPLQLPPRSLPMYFLNGIAGRPGGESSTLGSLAAARRKLNTFARLDQSAVAEIVVVGQHLGQSLESLKQLWQEGQRFLLSAATEDSESIASLEAWLESREAPVAADCYKQSVAAFADNLISEFRRNNQTDRIVVFMRRGKHALREVDITQGELPEQPVLDRYEVITRQATRARLPEELDFEDIVGFFDRTKDGWKAFAAGLPWQRDSRMNDRVRRALERVEASGPEANRLLVIESEPGAGGTTSARMVAFQMASLGYPTLVARRTPFAPSATELSSFLFRTLRVPDIEADPPEHEIPWLVVFDVEHWSGREQDLKSLMNQLTNDGRAVVVIAVTDDDAAVNLEGMPRSEVLGTLRHEVSMEDAVALGTHLNRFLHPHGRVRNESQWRSFWQNQRPSIDSPIASFWIALEFWLKGAFDLGDTIQQWTYRQFLALGASPQLEEIILQIAALTVERAPLADALLPRIQSQSLPTSILLEQCRSAAPALGLLHEHTEYGRRWALAHTQQGRHLLNAAYFDRRLCERISITDAQNPTQFRLRLLARVASKSDIAVFPHRALGIDFAVRILKLDPGQSAEFFPLWREVLSALEAVPAGLSRTSRTFLHHLAISRRRVATNTNFFDPTEDEKVRLLSEAAADIEAALGLPRSEGDESDLNLWNSLALAYQNLAELALRQGLQGDEVASYREKANAATLRAQQEDPMNPYVLETTAKNLVQSARLGLGNRVADATRALGYVYEAMMRDRSTARRSQLNKLFKEAVKLIRGEVSSGLVASMRERGEPLGCVAAAWAFLAEHLGDESVYEAVSENIDRDAALGAIEILKGARAENPLLVKLYYDLLAIAEPLDFSRQLELIEQLDSYASEATFQYQLEHAVLLHQVGRHLDATRHYQELRNAFRKHDVYVEVPKRMQWYLTPDRKARQICEARVAETGGYKHRAKIRDMGGVLVPFIPQEFGRRSYSLGELFSVSITFGATGPFAKPALHRAEGR